MQIRLGSQVAAMGPAYGRALIPVVIFANHTDPGAIWSRDKETKHEERKMEIDFVWQFLGAWDEAKQTVDLAIVSPLLSP